MGHLLATSNPDAAAAIKPEEKPFPVREPYVGETVQYYARPGEGRAGKQMFPAILHIWDEQGRAELTVIYAADDLRTYTSVFKKTHDRPWPAWDFAPYALDKSANNVMLDQAIFGKHTPVEESVYGMIIALGKRIAELEERLDKRDKDLYRKREQLEREKDAKGGKTETGKSSEGQSGDSGE